MLLGFPWSALRHKKPDGQEGRKGSKGNGQPEAGGQLSVPLPISSQMDIKNVKRFTRAEQTKALVAQLVRLANTLPNTVRSEEMGTEYQNIYHIYTVYYI